MIAQDITAVVLCGGESRRWGGVDKGLLMVDQVLRGVRPQVGAVVISANRHHSDYARRGHPVVADTTPGFAGPLAGISAALPRVQTPWVCWCPCDVPAAPPDWVDQLAQSLTQASTDVAVVQLNGRLEPLFALARAAWVGDPIHGAAAQLAAGQHSVSAWLRGGRYCAVSFSGPAATLAFKNRNTPDD